MNTISYVPSTYRHVIMRNSLYQFYTSASKYLLNFNNSTRKNCAKFSCIAPHVHYFSSKTKSARISKQPKVVDKKNNAYYVVRNQDLIGDFKRISDCQAFVSSLYCDPSVGKTNSVHKETEDDLVVIYGYKVPFNFQQPNGLASFDEETTYLDRERKMKSCIIELNGASKGNSGKAGAGAILRTDDGKVIAKLCEGLGNVTNNVAEYKALLLGLEYAFEKGFQKVQVKANSSLIVKQVTGVWKCRNESMKDLLYKVRELQENFDSFEIIHVRRQPSGLASLVEEKETMEETSLDKEGKMKSCIIEFDGASKGNPGKAGAGAILRTQDGKVIAKLCEGLGKATNNVAEYKSLLLGLKYAFEKGFQKIQVKGDSSLIVRQVKGEWNCKHKNMKDLCEEVIELKENFDFFEISHVRREFNSDADAQANLGADLPDGEIHVESSIPC